MTNLPSIILSLKKYCRFMIRYNSTIGQKKYNLPGMESFVAPLTILKGHQTTSRETADHSANSQKIP